MSITAINWARQQKTGLPLRKLLLLALADYCDQWGFCWPSQPTLANICEVDERSVRRTLKELEEAGFVAKVPIRIGRSPRVLYKLPSTSIAEPIPDEHPAQKWLKDTTRTKSPPETVHPDSGAVHPDSGDMLTRTHESGNPLWEPSENPNAPARAREGSRATALENIAAVAKKSYGRYRYTDEQLQECINASLLSVEEAIAAGGDPNYLRRIDEQGELTP